MSAKIPGGPTCKTGGNDGGDASTAPAAIVSPSADPNAPVKVRKDFVTGPEFSFSPGSLVGSWFHRLENDRMIWQGVVVAEPQPGQYLVQIDRLDLGAENVQRLIPLASMVSDEDGYDYRFYDDEATAKSAYAAWIVTERERVV